MKSLIGNAGLIRLEPDQMQLLEKRAELHRRYSAIEFKVLEWSDTKIVIRIVQGKSHAENYFDQHRLVDIVRETFGDLVPGLQVLARPYPYQPSPTAIVTADWIKKKMVEQGLKVKDLAHALGVDANTVSAYKNGVKPLSGVVRAMFYYYFKKH